MTLAEVRKHRYDSVNVLWADPANLPSITREEAGRAQLLLCRKFGRMSLDFPSQRRDLVPREIRRCWVGESTAVKGWPRLVHDLSHQVFFRRYPTLATHHPLHARLELEMAEYVLDSGWLTGSLRSAPKPKPDKMMVELDRIHAGIDRWNAKWLRAHNALDKLRKREAFLQRRLDKRGEAFARQLAGI